MNTRVIFIIKVFPLVFLAHRRQWGEVILAELDLNLPHSSAITSSSAATCRASIPVETDYNK